MPLELTAELSLQDLNVIDKQAPREIPTSDKSASSAASAETVSIVKSEYVLGQRALNSAHDHTLRRDFKRAVVEKTGVPSSAMSPLSAWAAKIDAMDKDVLSRASSSCSEFSTSSVADSVEFTETNPVSGLSKLYKIHENMNATGLAASSAAAASSAGVVSVAPPAAINKTDQDIDMPDAAGAEPMEEISTGGVLSVPLQQVCPISKSQLFEFSKPKSFDFDL